MVTDMCVVIKGIKTEPDEGKEHNSMDSTEETGAMARVSAKDKNLMGMLNSDSTSLILGKKMILGGKLTGLAGTKDGEIGKMRVMTTEIAHLSLERRKRSGLTLIKMTTWAGNHKHRPEPPTTFLRRELQDNDHRWGPRGDRDQLVHLFSHLVCLTPTLRATTQHRRDEQGKNPMAHHLAISFLQWATVDA